MGQIVRRKKKGRPAKADLRETGASPQGRNLRRSHRRRNVRYVFDLDDYFDDEGLFEDDEDQQRREKKLNLLLKSQSKGTGRGGPNQSTASQLYRSGRLQQPPTSPYASSSSEGRKPSKMRKIGEDMDEYVNDEFDDANENNICNEDDDEVREGNSEPKAEVLTAGTRERAAPVGLSLAEKKSLELILDKLQKKDIYGVYAEPVDPEELPDYHDVIDNPMDFATVRNKLRDGLYSSLDQLESDVFLICTNAKQYNAPDTVYYKQARTIQELAKKKFYKIRLNIGRPEKEIKPEQKIRSNSILNEQIKSSTNRAVQESMTYDFSSATTIGTAVDIQLVSNVLQSLGSDRLCIIDGLAERNSHLNENNLDRGEESLPGKGSLSRSGRKLLIHEEDRRATYGAPLAHFAAVSESIFSTFEGESKQLVPVGLYSDYSYTKSLARFAATLGSVAWGIASSRIEQALPQEFKYGRGWVGEFEPLPTVSMPKNYNVKELDFFAKKQCDVDPKEFGKICVNSVSSPGTMPLLDNRFPFLGPSGIRRASAPTNASFPIKASPVRENAVEMKASFFLATPGIKSGHGANIIQDQNSQTRNVVQSEKCLKQIELNGTSSFNVTATDSIFPRQTSNNSEMEVSRPMLGSRTINMSQSGSVKQPDIRGVSVGGLSNGKIVNNIIDSDTIVSSSSDLGKGIGCYTQDQGQALSSPALMMRMFAEKSKNQQKSPNPSAGHQVVSPVPNSDDLNNAAASAARAWMSVGAGGFRLSEEKTNSLKPVDSLYNSGRNLQSQVSRFCEESPAAGMHHPVDNNIYCFNASVSQNSPRTVRGSNNLQFQNQPIVFQSLSNADMSKFQLQSTWRSLSPQMNTRLRQESFPPDLNIGFQSSGSPGRPSSSVLVDSQQPDLALQL